MTDEMPSHPRRRRSYPRPWGYSVTSVCYRLGQLGWDTASAHAALQAILRCDIEWSTVSTGISDGDNPKYEQGRAAPLTAEQVAELARALGRPMGTAVGTPPEPFAHPDEVTGAEPLVEGACRTVKVNAYERDPEVRRRCIATHGISCNVCGMDFAAVYGSVAEGYIHVHHLRPLSEVGSAHAVDPVEDLRPVCPNCHAVLHRRVPAYSIEDVRGFLAQQRPAEPGEASGPAH